MLMKNTSPIINSMAVAALIILSGSAVTLRAADPSPTPAPAAAAASEVKVTLKAADGSTPVPSPSPSSTPSAATAAPAPAPVAAAPAGLFYENRLNDATGIELKNGATIGADASGVSGLPGDKAYVADASAIAAGQPGPLAVITNGPTARLAGDEVTLTLWYKPKTELKDIPTLMQGFPGYLLWDAKQGKWVMRLSAPVSDPNAKFASWLYSGKEDALKTPGQWVFLALTWKASDHSFAYYTGTPATAATVTAQGKRDLLGAVAEGANPRVLGNSDLKKSDRPFDGSIDDVRVFSKALDAAAIEKIRAADLKNEPVSL